MANKKPSNRFPPGNNANPNGRPPMPPEVRAIRRLTKEQLLEAGELVTGMTMDELQTLAKNPKSTVVQAMVAGLAIQAIKGSPSAFDALMNRLVGKVTDKIRHDGIPAPAVQTVITLLPINGFEKKMKDAERA